MLISNEVSGFSPLFTLHRDGTTVVATLSYGLTGFYDEELGYYLWNGEIIANIGDAVGYLYQDADRPMDLTYSATADDGVTYLGRHEINDYVGGALIILDFTVTAFSSAGVLAGGDLGDFVFGSEFADRLRGEGGDDRIESGGGRDFVDGGAGADRLSGGQHGDRVNGGDGNDVIRGDRGDDVLSGGLGVDHLFGGKGADVFLFEESVAPDSLDILRDFQSGKDVIRLAADVFDALGGPGGLTPDQFVASADGAATTEDHRIIYDTDSGELFYDADGSGVGSAILFARTAPGLSLTAADFEVV